MISPLLVTKLHLPSLRSPLVQRKRLLEKLNQGLSTNLILISAAAGFGKTTLLSEWLQQVKLPVGWLSLDERDNDPTRFWLYFVAALQQGIPNLGEATLAMLRGYCCVPSHPKHRSCHPESSTRFDDGLHHLSASATGTRGFSGGMGSHPGG